MQTHHLHNLDLEIWLWAIQFWIARSTSHPMQPTGKLIPHAHVRVQAVPKQSVCIHPYLMCPVLLVHSHMAGHIVKTVHECAPECRILVLSLAPRGWGDLTSRTNRLTQAYNAAAKEVGGRACSSGVQGRSDNAQQAAVMLEA